jgi:putative transposase
MARMPWSLKRFQATRGLHFITFSCYRRRPRLRDSRICSLFEAALEQVRLRFDFLVLGYIIMPEHVHLLVSEPVRAPLAIALQVLKQTVSRKAREQGFHTEETRFWQVRYYDFNVATQKKLIEKLRYLHRNPVTRGLVDRPEDWHWSSFRHYSRANRARWKSSRSGQKRGAGMPSPRLRVPHPERSEAWGRCNSSVRVNLTDTVP